MTAVRFRVLQVALFAAIGAMVASVSLCAQDPLRWPAERPPRPLAARPASFPPYEIRTLPNGLQVVLVSQNEQPAVSARMIVKAGGAQDPTGKDGVAMLTAALLDQGTATRSAQQIADQIDFMGGILGTGAGTDLSYVNTVVMKDDFGTGLELMSDIVRNPAFAEAEIGRQRQQALSSLKVSEDDPDAVASRVIDRLIFGFHPYGRPSGGTEESITAVTRDDLVEFHNTWFAPNNALIAVVGDITPDAAFAQVQRVFGNWPSHDVPPVAATDPPPPVRRVVVIDKPDAVQTEIRVGHLALPRKHEDYFALDQAVKILGGEGANRLQQVLRTQKGLTYGASADLQALKQAGGIVAETDTRTEATTEALRTTVDEFARIQRERVYAAELEGAQAFMAGSFPLSIENPDAIATQVLNQLFYELPLEQLQTYRERVTAVTADDIQRVARTWIKPDKLSIVLVGNAQAFVADLKGAGFPEVERIPIEELDLSSADLRKPRRGPGSDRRRRMTRVMISCGESSGDLYAGALAVALRERRPDVDVFGFGGARLAAAGGRLVADYHGLSVTGLTEALRILPKTYATFRQLVAAARTTPPDALVLIDYPDFNFRLMHAAAGLGIPVIYYVTPQLWAWRAGRMRTIRAEATLAVPIFPFEEALYRREGVPVKFVGHPLVDLAVASEPREAFLRAQGLDPARPVVALLPGSRHNELHQLLPVVAAAVPAIAAAVPGVQFVVACAPAMEDALFAPLRALDLPIAFVRGRADDVLAASDVVILASVTATVQTALHERPMVVIYKLSPLTYTLGKPLVKVDTYAMANLVAGERVVPELIQDGCTPERVVEETVSLLTDRARWTTMHQRLRDVRARLGAPGASGRVADAVLEVADRERAKR